VEEVTLTRHRVLALALLITGCGGGGAAPLPDAPPTTDLGSPTREGSPLPDGPRADHAIANDVSAREAAGAPLVLVTPVDGARLVVGKPVEFKGSTSCANATIEFVADGKYPFGALTAISGAFSYSHSFSSAGVGRQLTVKASGTNGCGGTVTRTVTIQPALALEVTSLKDGSGCTFQVHSVVVPLADDTIDVSAVGADPPRTVQQLASDASKHNPLAAINTGFFGFGFGPVSYAKGHLGYESPSGNVKGPRACLVYDRVQRTARVELSMGRQPVGSNWGAGLFPADSDVSCAGPQLVAKGANVAMAHYASESFQTSGISATSPYPRTAACVRDDGSLLLVVAQSATTKACGFDLDGLADHLISRGCVDALNFDGGGSSAMWWLGPPVVYFPGTEDRSVYLGLVVYRK
jgi:hypothetical protein